MSSDLIFLFILMMINGRYSNRVGHVKYASIKSQSNLISTMDRRCSDCLCQCLNNNNNRSQCYGINCYPSNHSCQYIEQQWINDDQLTFDPLSDQFITSINLKFCSCYPKQILRNTSDILTTLSIPFNRVRFIFYHSYDQTLIVLGNQMITQYFISNLTRFRSWTVTSIPLNVIADSTSIYITYHNNVTINQYDLQMNYLRTVRRPIRTRNEGHLYGLTQWKDQIFVGDQQLNLIWLLNSTDMVMSIYRNMSIDNILVFNLIAFDNRLYISQLSLPTILILDLLTLSTRSVTFTNAMPLYRMQIDPFCNRIWFGLNSRDYNTIPVLDLSTNQMHLYRSPEIFSRIEVHLIIFDSNSSMYTVKTEDNGFNQYSMLTDACE